MILRTLYFKTGLKSEAFYYFSVGFFYSLLGIVLGRLIFSQNIGLAAVFLVSLAAISEVDKKLSISEMILGKTKRIGGKILYLEEMILVEHKITLKSIYDDHRGLFKTYFFVFLGIMLCFSVVILVLSPQQSLEIFGEQFKVISGSAFLDAGVLEGILLNNLQVLFIGFFLALLFEFGTTFIIVWNASVWGAAFALAAKQSLLLNFGNPFLNFIIIIAVVLTYLPLEAAAYFSSTIGGGLLHKAITREKIFSTRFRVIAIHTAVLLGFGVFLLAISALIEVQVIGLIR